MPRSNTTLKVKTAITSCISIRLWLSIFPGPKSTDCDPPPKPTCIRDTESSTSTLRGNSALAPWSCSQNDSSPGLICRMTITTGRFQKNINNNYPQSRQFTCRVKPLKWSPKLASPRVSAICNPLPSRASTILIILTHKVNNQYQKLCKAAHWNSNEL